MKRSLLFLLLMAMFAPLTMMGQETLTVNEGTATSNTVPMYVFYWDDFTRAQTVFPASQLEDMAGGTITSITFYTTSGNIPYTSVATYDAYLAEVDDATISSFIDRSAATTVISEATAEFVAEGEGGKITITLTTPYVYGGGNLLFGCDNNTDAGYKSIYFYGMSGVSGASISGSNGTAGGSISPNQRNFLPKTTFEYIPGAGVTCEKPTDLVVDYAAGTTATATWNGTANLYNIDINGTVAEGVTSPYTFAIEPNTTYTVKVQADCGGGDLSYWTTVPSYTTPCNAYSLPYEYGFEDPADFECWTMVNCNTSSGIANSSDYVHEGSAAFCFVYNTTPPQYLISPMFEGTSTGLDVSFYYKNTSDSWPETFQVGYSTTTNETSAFTWGTEITANDASTWVLYEDSFPAGTKFVAVKLNSNDKLRLCLDDFTFEAPSSCRKPTNLTATEIGKRSITLSWTENGEASAWNLMVDRDLIENVTNPYTLTGLTPATTYILKVCPVCEVEKWSDEITITTEEACPAPTNLSATALTPYSATMTWKGSDDEYEMEYAVLGAGAVGDITYEFETDLEGWTGIIVNADQGEWLHSTEQPYGYDYSEIAHGGTGFAMCYSFVDYTGSYNTDAYLVSPSAYQINSGASLNFWYDMANDSYPEYFEVCVATAANPTAEDFTAIWTWSDAKASLDPNRKVPMGNSNMRHVNRNRYDNWREVTVDLSAYVGQTIWIAFHDVNYDAYEVWIDDVNVNAGAGGEITWIPVGTVTSPYTLENLDPGTGYLVHVRANCGEDGESAWISTSFTTPSLCDAPFDLEVTNLMPTTATLNWTGYQDGFEVRYRPAVSYEPIFEETFENGIPSTWTTIDNDTTTLNNWLALSGLMDAFSYYTSIPDWAHSGSDAAMSPSYANGVGAFATDQYLVTPQLTLDGTLRFYAASTYSDEFEVLLSTTTNEMSAFTITLRPMTAVSTTTGWDEISIDLSDYAGQQGYIAIHHVFADGYFLIIDDFGLYNELDNEWNIVSTDAQFVDIEDLDPETEYEWQVRGENRDCGEEGYTVWSAMGNFTTPGLCDEIESISIDELTATSITLSWTGYQESYNIRYRTAEVSTEYFYDAFDSGDLSLWTYDNLASTSVYTVTSSGIMGYVFFYDEETGVQTLISTEMDPTISGTVLGFYTASEGTSTYKVGFSSTDNALESFEWSGELTVEGDGYFHAYEGDVPEGTKYFAVQFTSNDTENGYMIVTLFEVYLISAEAGEWITLEGVNSPYTIDGLTPETDYQVYVQGVCGEGEFTEWLGGSFTTPELTTVTQTIALITGSNWFSTYVDITLADLQDALVAAASAQNKNITIKSSTGGNSVYSRNKWNTPASFVWDVAQMYYIIVTEDCEITLEGMPLDPAEHPITIVGDGVANWIGFPFSTEMSVTDAFAALPPTNNDKVKNSSTTATYTRGKWNGGFNLVPGQGYIYISAQNSADRVLTYPSASGKSGQPATSNMLVDKKPMRDRKALAPINNLVKKGIRMIKK